MNLSINGIKIDQSLVKNLLNKAESNLKNKAPKSLINDKFDNETIEILAIEPKEDFSNLLYYCNNITQSLQKFL